MPAKKSTAKKSKSFEESLWDTATTYKLAKMNLAVRGLSANLGEVPVDTFFKDQHPDPAWRGTDYAWIFHMVSKLSEDILTLVGEEFSRTLISNSKSAS